MRFVRFIPSTLTLACLATLAVAITYLKNEEQSFGCGKVTGGAEVSRVSEKLYFGARNPLTEWPRLG